MRFRRHAALAFLASLALVASACGGTDGKSAATTTTAAGPSVSITSPANGAHIKGNVVTLALRVAGIQIVKADGDASGTTGHFHVFVDKEPVAPGVAIEKAPGIIHSIDNPIVVPGLSVGLHTLSVVLGDGTHTRTTAKAAVVKITVDGPALHAAAPATIAAGDDLSIDVTVTGVELMKADGDITGATGHLHAFVDTPPVAPGEAIPTGNPAIIHSATSPIVVTGLAAGEHVIWIVLGDGTHTAFKESVRDKVTVTVT